MRSLTTGSEFTLLLLLPPLPFAPRLPSLSLSSLLKFESLPEFPTHHPLPRQRPYSLPLQLELLLLSQSRLVQDSLHQRG